MKRKQRERKKERSSTSGWSTYSVDRSFVWRRRKWARSIEKDSSFFLSFSWERAIVVSLSKREKRHTLGCTKSASTLLIRLSHKEKEGSAFWGREEENTYTLPSTFKLLPAFLNFPRPKERNEDRNEKRRSKKIVKRRSFFSEANEIGRSKAKNLEASFLISSFARPLSRNALCLEGNQEVSFMYVVRTRTLGIFFQIGFHPGFIHFVLSPLSTVSSSYTVGIKKRRRRSP